MAQENGKTFWKIFRKQELTKNWISFDKLDDDRDLLFQHER